MVNNSPPPPIPPPPIPPPPPLPRTHPPLCSDSQGSEVLSWSNPAVVNKFYKGVVSIVAGSNIEVGHWVAFATASSSISLCSIRDGGQPLWTRSPSSSSSSPSLSSLLSSTKPNQGSASASGSGTASTGARGAPGGTSLDPAIESASVVCLTVHHGYIVALMDVSWAGLSWVGLELCRVGGHPSSPIHSSIPPPTLSTNSSTHSFPAERHPPAPLSIGWFDYHHRQHPLDHHLRRHVIPCPCDHPTVQHHTKSHSG